MRWSIRWQLVIPLLIVWLGVLLLTAWAGVATARQAMRRQIEVQLRNVARTLSEATFPLTPGVLTQMKGLSGADYHVIDDAGRSATTLSTPLESSPDIPVAQRWQEVSLGPAFTLNDTRYLASGLRWRRPSDKVGSTLYALYPETAWRAAFWEALQPALWCTLLGGLVSLVVTLLVADRLTRRLAELERRTKLIADGDFSPMTMTGSNDELRSLGTSINLMAERLKHLHEVVRQSERFRLLGQVSGGLAHQLRNGMTGAKLAVQLHARQCVAENGDGALDVALRQLALLEEKLQRFLDLGNEHYSLRAACSLTRVVDESIALLTPQARHARVEMQWHKPEAIVDVSGDAGQLGHVVVNVITNALEAAGADGQVAVELVQEESDAVLRIEDSGQGPTATVADRLFEPFVTSKPGGVGLGLAVARQVLERHGGSIGWERRDGHTRFTIRLPLSETTHGTHPDH